MMRIIGNVSRYVSIFALVLVLSQSTREDTLLLPVLFHNNEDDSKLTKKLRL